MKAKTIDDPARALLVQLVAKGATTLQQVSLKLGLNAAYLQQFVRVGKPKILPETVRVALGQFFAVHPNRFLPSDPGPEHDMELLARAVRAAELICGNDPAGRELRAHITAAAYTLLNREKMGLPITDDDGTLYVFESLYKRLQRRSARRSPADPRRRASDDPKGDK